MERIGGRPHDHARRTPLTGRRRRLRHPPHRRQDPLNRAHRGVNEDSFTRPRHPYVNRGTGTRVCLVGTIYYGGSATPIHIEDRALAHLKVVIATKLRRNESFTVSWQHPDDQPRGRSTLWLHPSIPLRFVFDDPEPAELSRAWIEELANSANSSGGISLIADHFDTEPVLTLAEAGAQVPSDSALGDVQIEHLRIDKLTVSDAPS